MTKVQQRLTSQGYCCRNGQPTQISQSECRKPHDTYFPTKQQADKHCTGFCCISGNIVQVAEKTCDTKRGLFFRNKRDAETECAKQRGYCCKESRVSQSTQKECKQTRGVFFHSQQVAIAQCRGYCCIAGKSIPLNKRECQTQKGMFYRSKTEASLRCKSPKGYCNDKGKTLQMTQKACGQRHGKFFATEPLAHAALRMSRTKEQNKRAKMAPVASQTGISPAKMSQPQPHRIVTPIPPVSQPPQESPQLRNLPPHQSDLYLSQHIWSKTPIAGTPIGQAAIMTITVTNKGTTASSETNMSLLLESAPGGLSPPDTKNLQMSIPIPSLNPGQPFAFTWPQSSTETWRKGSYTVQTSIQLDPAGESDEMNNTRKINFTTQSIFAITKATTTSTFSKKTVSDSLSSNKPDLTVTLEPPDKTLYQHGTYIFRGTVENIGSASSPPARLILSLVGKGAISMAPAQEIPGLGPGWGVNVSFQGGIDTTSNGEKRVVLQVDPANVLDEINENNNISEYTVFCAQPHKTYELGLFQNGSAEEHGQTHVGYRTELVDIPIRVHNFLDNTTSPQTTLTISCDSPQDVQTVTIEPISAGNNLLNYRDYHFLQKWSTNGIKQCQAKIVNPPGYTDANTNNNLMDFKVQIIGPIEPWQTE